MNLWEGLILLGVSESNKMNPNSLLDLDKVKKAEKFTVNAECINKYTGSDGYMYVVFKTEKGEKVSLPVPVLTFGEIEVGEYGELYYGIKKMVKIFGSWKPKN